VQRHRPASQGIEGTAHTNARLVGRVQVDFRGGNVRMPKKILHVADANATGQQVRCETMAQRVRRDPLVESRAFHGRADCLLECDIQDMMAADDAAAVVAQQIARGPEPEPDEFLTRLRPLAFKRLRQLDPRQVRFAIFGMQESEPLAMGGQGWQAKRKAICLLHLVYAKGPGKQPRGQSAR
jgi:hypothetical protein